MILIFIPYFAILNIDILTAFRNNSYWRKNKSAIAIYLCNKTRLLSWCSNTLITSMYFLLPVLLPLISVVMCLFISVSAGSGSLCMAYLETYVELFFNGKDILTL